MPIVIMIGQFFANFAAAVLTPTLIIFQQTTIPLFGIQWPIFAYAFFGVLGYFAFNSWSALRRPGGEAYYHLDLWPSVIAAISIFGTAIAVFGFDQSKDFIAGIPGMMQLLQSLVFVALYDIFINQRENGWEMIARIAKLKSRRTEAPGAFGRYDTAEAVEESILNPGDARVRLIYTPFLERLDGSLVRWGPRQAPAIEHAPQQSGTDPDAPPAL